MSEFESGQDKAVRLLNRQLVELNGIRPLNYKHPNFAAWRDTTRHVLESFLGPESHYTTRFRDLKFFAPGRMIPVVFGGPPPPPPDYVSPADADAFRSACDVTETTLRAALRHIEDFGVYIESAKPAAGRGKGRIETESRGGVHQTFHGPVTFQNQAIATDSAIQKIDHMGNSTGASLREIAALLQQSEELTPKQVKEGLAGIQTLAEEAARPEAQRNWKSVLDYGQAVLAVADKATDLAHKLAPYTPAIVALVEKARHALG